MSKDTKEANTSASVDSNQPLPSIIPPATITTISLDYIIKDFIKQNTKDINGQKPKHIVLRIDQDDFVDSDFNVEGKLVIFKNMDDAIKYLLKDISLIKGKRNFTYLYDSECFLLYQQGDEYKKQYRFYNLIEPNDTFKLMQQAIKLQGDEIDRKKKLEERNKMAGISDDD